MTLLISCMTPDFVIQASDRRLTFTDGTVADDEANKATVFCGHWMIAYTGLAEVGPPAPPRNRPRTDVWLAQLLSDPGLSAKEGFDRIARAAEQEIRSIPLAGEQKSHAFVGVGWIARRREGREEPWPAMVVVSNYLDAKGHVTAPPADRFAVDAIQLNPKRRYYWSWAGQQLSGDEAVALNRLIKKAVGRERPLGVALLLAGQIRAIAARNPAVGESLMIGVFPRTDVPAQAVSMPLTGPPERDRLSFVNLPKQSDSPVRYAPNVACGGMVIVGAETWTKRPPWWQD